MGPFSGKFATVLDHDRIPSKWRLFMTATPRYFTGQVRRGAGEADLELVSMDDPKHFGTVFHRLTFGQAIERDLLSDYRVVIVGVDNPTYEAYADRGQLVARGEDAKVEDAAGSSDRSRKDRSRLRPASHLSASTAGLRKRATSPVPFPSVVSWMPEAERLSGAVGADYVSGDIPSGQQR